MQSIRVTSFGEVRDCVELSNGRRSTVHPSLIGEGLYAVPMSWLKATRPYLLEANGVDERQMVVNAALRVLRGLNDLIREEYDTGIWWPILNDGQLLIPKDASRFSWLHGRCSWIQQGEGPRWLDIRGVSEGTFLPDWFRNEGLIRDGIAHYNGPLGRILMFWRPTSCSLSVWADPQLRGRLGLPPE